jgi:hypothetical protein
MVPYWQQREVETFNLFRDMDPTRLHTLSRELTNASLMPRLSTEPPADSDAAAQIAAASWSASSIR